MNERFNELRLDAGISRLHDEPYLVVINKSGEIIDPLIGLEKFARLIVRECADIAKQTDTDDGDDYKSGRVWAGIDILKHFNVRVEL